LRTDRHDSRTPTRRPANYATSRRSTRTVPRSRGVRIQTATGSLTGARAALAALSEREREVALALGRGKSNAEIAAGLFMSVATVKAHVSRLLVKLSLNNRVQVALLVHDAGLA